MRHCTSILVRSVAGTEIWHCDLVHERNGRFSIWFELTSVTGASLDSMCCADQIVFCGFAPRQGSGQEADLQGHDLVVLRYQMLNYRFICRYFSTSKL